MHSLTSLLFLSFVELQAGTAPDGLGLISLLPRGLISLFTLPVLGALMLVFVSASVAVLIEMKAEKRP